MVLIPLSLPQSSNHTNMQKSYLLLQMHPSFNISGYLEIYHYYICPGFIITWSICISNYFSLDMIMDIFPIWFFFVILISFDALELLFSVSTSVNRKGLLMRSLQVSQHTDILQTQRRFYPFCYSTKFQHLRSTSYFQELTQNTHKKVPINLQTQNLLLNHYVKICSQGAASCLSGGTENKEKSSNFWVKSSILSIQSWHTSLHCQSSLF